MISRASDAEEQALSQSLAIIDYLELAYPGGPSLYPADPFLRAKALQLALVVASGIQPLQNLRMLQYVAEKAGADERQKYGTSSATLPIHWGVFSFLCSAFHVVLRFPAPRLFLLQRMTSLPRVCARWRKAPRRRPASSWSATR